MNQFFKKVSKRLRQFSLFGYRPLFELYGFTQSLFNQPIPLQSGFKMYVNPADTVVSPYIKKNKKWSEYETNIIKKNLQPGQTFLDVGANIGYFSLLASQIVGEKGKVFSFEPEPRNVGFLTKNIELNNFTQTVVIPQAVGEKPGQLTFYLEEENKGDHRSFDSGDGRRTIQVPMTSIDAFFKQNTSPLHYMKVDVQGFEIQVLKGMKETLKKNPECLLMFEYWPYGLEKAGDKPEELFEQLHKQGYQLFEVKEELRLLTKTELRQFCTDTSFGNDMNVFGKKKII